MLKREKEDSSKRNGAASPTKQMDELEAELAEREQNRRRNFNYRQASTVHGFSAGMISCTTAMTLIYCYLYWKCGLIEMMLKDIIFCVIAESFVVCWGIVWWKQLAPKILAAKNPSKNFRFTVCSMLLIGALYAPAVLMDAINGATPISSFSIMFFLLGMRICLELGFTWWGYRKSAKYKVMNFTDFCNEIEN